VAKKRPPATAGKLAGKKVAFVGKVFHYFLGKYEEHIARAGGTVVDPERVEPDYLFVGEGRGGKPPGDVARLQKRYPAVQALDRAGFFQLLIPDRAELLQLIATRGLDAPTPRESSGWDHLAEMMQWAGATIDLTGADLHDANLTGAHFDLVTLDDANLSGAKLEYAHCRSLKRVNLDRVQGENLYLTTATDCTFREASLPTAWMFWASGKLIERCDFTAATMPRTRLGENGASVRASTFQRADLSGTRMEWTTFDQVDFRDADLSGVLGGGTRFIRVDLRGAKLCRADLRNAILVGADLRNADLRDATLNEADLTNAKVDGADFAGAVLTGAKLGGVEVEKAKNLRLPVVRVPGPGLTELAAVAAEAKKFETSAEVDLGDGQFARLRLFSRIDKGTQHCSAQSDHFRGEDNAVNWIAAPSFEQGLLNLSDRWPNATLRLDTVQAKGGRTLRGEKLQALAVAAWSEVFGVQQSGDELLQEQAEAARTELEQLVARMRTEGIAAWNALDYRVQKRFKDMSGVDLHGLELGDIRLDGKILDGCQFQGASMDCAHLGSARLREADLTGAKLGCMWAYAADCSAAKFDNAILQNARLEKANLSRASLRGADLTGADLTGAKLHGADLTDAILTDAKLSGAEYDPDTRLPAGFTPPPDMIWTGPPRKVRKVKTGSLTFEAFAKRLAKKVASDRLRKVAAMLKKETFQLFAEVTDDAVVGVVRSQSSKELVYSCRLASDGGFCCATQNLKPCGGLRGGLCKHLLVLIVGLTKTGTLDPATVDAWIDASRSRKPALDLKALGETFLRYQSAQEGTIDWRPTETVPEDYYAL
jgi:uncharacterized protein YjbI with pentapeptide repeats